MTETGGKAPGGEGAAGDVLAEGGVAEEAAAVQGAGPVAGGGGGEAPSRPGWLRDRGLDRLRALCGDRLWERVAILAGCLLVALVLVGVFNLHQSGFVIHARTEAVRILEIRANPNDGWRIDGAQVCEDPPFTATEPQPAPNCLAVLPKEPFFTPADGSAVTIRSLSSHRLEAVITPSVAMGQGNGAGAASHLRSYADGSGERRFAGTLRIVWEGEALHAPLVFLGEALIGYAPESGNPGVTLGGTAAGYMAARGGAPRFEISRAEIVPGDVMSVEMPGRASLAQRLFCRALAQVWLVSDETCEAAGPMHGVILWPAEGGDSGFEIVYAGPAERIRVDRLGTRFELAPDWTSRIRNDPLLLILSGAVTLFIGIAGLLLGLGKRGE